MLAVILSVAVVPGMSEDGAVPRSHLFQTATTSVDSGMLKLEIAEAASGAETVVASKR